MAVRLTEAEALVLGIERKRGSPLALNKPKKKRKSAGEEMFALQVMSEGLPEPERESRFHPTRRWRFDFAWIGEKIAVEIEGGVYVNGRHTRGKGFENDCIKYAEAALLGWQVIRFSTQQVKAGTAINYVKQFLSGAVDEQKS